MASTELNDIEKQGATWGEGNIPYSETLAFDEEVIDGVRRSRSFRAELTHKLNAICASMPRRTWDEVAETLDVTTAMIRQWRAWKRAPGSRDMWQRIDNHYEVAIERMRRNLKRH